MDRTAIRIAKRSLVLCLSILGGCSHQEFQRFLDDPILSWAPFTQSDLNRLDPLASPALVQKRFPDEDCRQLARERTQVLSGEEFDDGALATIFADNYRRCIADKIRYGSVR